MGGDPSHSLSLDMAGPLSKFCVLRAVLGHRWRSQMPEDLNTENKWPEPLGTAGEHECHLRSSHRLGSRFWTATRKWAELGF